MKAANMNTVHVVNRRGFLGTVFSAGALVLGAKILPGNAIAAEVNPGKQAWYPTVYLGVEPDGKVVIVAHRSEMGTGIRTALPMVAADELDVELSKVRVEQALGDKKYGSQDTDGSNSIRSFYDPLRIAGATARAMLVSAAAVKWGVPASECKGVNGYVTHTGGSQKASYGELAALAAQQPVPKPETLKFKSPSEYRYIGKGVPSVDLDDLVSGHGKFGMDAKMPGMVYASIEHPPVIGGKVTSVDDAEARKVRGVQQTVQIDRYNGTTYGFQPLGGVAVIADNTWAAMQGRKKLKIDWDLGRECELRFGFLQSAADRDVPQAVQSGAQHRRCGQGVRRRGEDSRSRILLPDAGPRLHGAARCRSGVQERQGRNLDGHAESAGRAGHGLAGAGDQTGRCGLPRHTAGRGFRTQVEARLRGGSGSAFEESRQAGQGCLVARRRREVRLLSLRRRDVSEGCDRREG